MLEPGLAVTSAPSSRLCYQLSALGFVLNFLLIACLQAATWQPIAAWVEDAHIQPSLEPSLQPYLLALIAALAGAVVLGAASERFGRRPLVLLCLIVAMVMTVAASESWWLFTGIIPLAVGFAVGGGIVLVMTLVIEFVKAEMRDTLPSLAASGLIFGWFGFSTIVGEPNHPRVDMTTALQVLAGLLFLGLLASHRLLPESLQVLARSDVASVALRRYNRVLVKLGHTPIYRLPSLPRIYESWIAYMLMPRHLLLMVAVWVVFALVFSVNFNLYLGFRSLSAFQQAEVEHNLPLIAYLGIGTIFGILSLIYVCRISGLKMTMLAYGATGTLVLLLLGVGVLSAAIPLALLLTGFSVNGLFICLFPFAAHIYPLDRYGTAIGWAVAVGFLGAICTILISSSALHTVLGSSNLLVLNGLMLCIANIVIALCSSEEVLGTAGITTRNIGAR